MLPSTDNPDVRRIVSKICSRYEVDSDLLPEPDFVNGLLSTYSGSDNLADLEQWLVREIPLKFPALNERPVWLQASEWPFANGRPMIFLGQIDVGAENTPEFDKYFHAYTSFYIFMPQGGGKFVVVMQQM